MAGPRVSAGVLLRVAGGGEAAVGGEADVVELDLVEALAHGLPRDGDVVVPDLGAEGVDPGEFLVVDPGPPGSPFDDGQIAPVVSRTLSLNTTTRAMV